MDKTSQICLIKIKGMMVILCNFCQSIMGLKGDGGRVRQSITGDKEEYINEKIKFQTRELFGDWCRMNIPKHQSPI